MAIIERERSVSLIIKGRTFASYQQVFTFSRIQAMAIYNVRFSRQSADKAGDKGSEDQGLHGPNTCTKAQPPTRQHPSRHPLVSPL
jgi:hypothetical protein